MGEGVVLTGEYLAQVRARCEAATEGPWFVSPPFAVDEDRVTGNTLWGPRLKGQRNGVAFDFGDSEFIARARTDVPALLAAAEALPVALAEAKAARAEVAAMWPVVMAALAWATGPSPFAAALADEDRSLLRAIRDYHASVSAEVAGR